MADLDQQAIQNLSELCRIECTEDEQQVLLQDLKKILDHIAQLKEIDTSGIEPCYHVLEDMANVTREDVCGETLPRDAFLANAPSSIGGLVKVPPVIKPQG